MVHSRGSSGRPGEFDVPFIRPSYSCPMRKLFIFASLALTVVILLVTLGPVADRPQFGHPQLERFSAFFLLAVAWSLALPGRRWGTAVGLAVAAALLELSQGLVPHRDPGAIDALAKMAGAILGVAAVGAIEAVNLRAARLRN
jgi:hypothetical protein